MTHFGLVAEAMGWGQAGVAISVLLTLLVHSDPGAAAWARPEFTIVQDRVFVMAIMTLIGALLLAWAGRGLTDGSTGPIRPYLLLGVPALAAPVLYGVHTFTLDLVLTLLAVWAWPALMAVALWRRPKNPDALPGRFPSEPAQELAGLATIMIPAAAIELVVAAGLLWVLFTLGSTGAGILVVGLLLLVTMLVRAALQLAAAPRVRAGSVELVQRYGQFGMASAVVFLFILLIMEREAGIPILGLSMALFAWPYVVWRFARRNRDEVPETEAGGATTASSLVPLGWWLLFFGVPQLLVAAGGLLGASFAGDSFDMQHLVQLVVACLQMWTGVELLTASRRVKLAALSFGVVGVAAALFTWRAIAATAGTMQVEPGSPGAVAAAATVAFPLATLYLVFRAQRPDRP